MKLKISMILILFFMIFLALSNDFFDGGLNKYQPAPILVSQVENDYQTTFVASYESNKREPKLENLQCPIPMQDRVKNYTGIQCVYSSIEMLGRWAEEPKLTNPPITSRPECKGYSGPSQAARILNNLQIKFEQTYGDKDKGLELIKKAMKQGRGVLWGVPGHAMVLIHYSEEQNKVCWVDNSDSKLRVQQTTIKKFKERWNSWVLVIYADNDIAPYKANNHINLMPIIDEKNKKQNYPIDYIPIPLN
jgi:hypothetical protein